MKIYNEFGIKPTNSFQSAGSDYYIPNLDNEEKISKAFKAFENSYHKTESDIKYIANMFKLLYKEHEDQYANLTLLYLSLYDRYLSDIEANNGIDRALVEFVNEFVIYDESKHVVGIQLAQNDALFINSGIKIALDTVVDANSQGNPDIMQKLKSIGIGIGGLYVNKSGKGNAGFDVRACLVDQDYSGYVHLSLAYTKDTYSNQSIIYSGDKIIQMMLVPVFHTEYEEVSEEEYDNIMKDSKRGNLGFGSQDFKH